MAPDTLDCQPPVASGGTGCTLMAPSWLPVATASMLELKAIPVTCDFCLSSSRICKKMSESAPPAISAVYIQCHGFEACPVAFEVQHVDSASATAKGMQLVRCCEACRLVLRKDERRISPEPSPLQLHVLCLHPAGLAGAVLQYSARQMFPFSGCRTLHASLNSYASTPLSSAERSSPGIQCGNLYQRHIELPLAALENYQSAVVFAAVCRYG